MFGEHESHNLLKLNHQIWILVKENNTHVKH